MHGDEVCAERSGFLFAHACPQPAAYTCNQCQKRVCGGHLKADGEGEELCTSCARKQIKREQRHERGHGRRGHYRDPYGYGDYHYSGWGMYVGTGYWGHRYYSSSYRDDNDFTAGDEAAFASAGDEAFEGDYDAS